MLTVAEETVRQLAAEHGKEVVTHLYGQEINAETYAICKADLLLKCEGEAAHNIVGAPSTPRCPTTRSRRASSTSCCPIRPTARVGRPT